MEIPRVFYFVKTTRLFHANDICARHYFYYKFIIIRFFFFFFCFTLLLGRSQGFEATASDEFLRL